MTPRDIVNNALIPGTNSVLVLGSFEKRVTVYSQQVRALNLVDAILSENLVRPNGKVAIVGGGVAGITAGVALSKAAPNLKKLDLFESRPRILELQHGSRRYLHPHFYDWPASGSEKPDAGLPIMNWSAGPAGEVVKVLRDEFEVATHSSILTAHLGQKISELKPSNLGSVRVVAQHGTAINRIYDVVILAIGFGLEAFLGGETPPYWTPSGLAGPILTPIPDPTIFISGNGDGGLVDFMMAAFNALEHREICDLLLRLDIDSARAELELIEQEAWAANADIDLLRAYQVRVRPLIPSAAWAEISEQLRSGVRIRLHTREPRLFRRTTALHNRLITFLILEADKEMGNNTITVTVGVDFVGAPPMLGAVMLAGESPFIPFRRFLRLGPDASANLAPFKNLLMQYPGATAIPMSATKPESPLLTISARTRFNGLHSRATSATSTAPTTIAPAVNTYSVILSLVGPEQASWAGNVGLNNIEQIWSGQRSVSVYCNITAADAGRLVPAIARLGAHAQSFGLHAHDSSGWQTGLAALCSDHAFPGPDLDIRCPVSDWCEPPDFPVQVATPINQLAATIHNQLNAATLRHMHVSLYNILGPAAIPIGWPIQHALRQKLWEIWERWHTILLADQVVNHRFLQLLSIESDYVDVDDTVLVRIGPKIMRPYLTKPVIFGLAFAACSGHLMAPAINHPGNMAFDTLTGHACGVSWIDKRALGTQAVTRRAWTTSIVLLSQLREAVHMMESYLRLDRGFTDPPSVRMTSVSEGALIIGADDAFISALEEGEAAVRQYLESIFQRRAYTARRALEGGKDDNG